MKGESKMSLFFKNKRPGKKRLQIFLSVVLMLCMVSVNVLPTFATETMEQEVQIENKEKLSPVISPKEEQPMSEENIPEESTEEENPPAPEEETELSPKPEENIPEENTGEGNPSVPEEETELSPKPEENTEGTEPSSPGEETETEEEPEKLPNSDQNTNLPVDENAVPHPLTPEEIRNVKLYYREKPENEWLEVKTGSRIPGDASMLLRVDFDSIQIENLIKNNGGIISYQLPSLLRNPEAAESIKAYVTNTQTGLPEEKNVGTLQATGNLLTLNMDLSWLQEQYKNQVKVLNGSFFVVSGINLSEIPEGGVTNLVIGNVSIALDFGENVISKYGKVDIQKSVKEQVVTEESEGKEQDYLEYTLRVKAGSDGCREVKVEDSFAVAGSFVNEQAQIFYADKNLPEGVHLEDSDKKLVWEIGDMKPDEEREIIYRMVLPQDRFLNKDIAFIQNEAKVYAGEFLRNQAKAVFEPKASLGMKKEHKKDITFHPEDGCFYITYQGFIEAEANYPIRKITVSDMLNHPNHLTKPEALKGIQYVKDSFVLKKTTAEGATVEDKDHKPNWNADEKGFTLTFDKMNSGDRYDLQYQIKVSPEALGKSFDGKVEIRNRLVANAQNAQMTGRNFLQAYSHTTQVGFTDLLKKVAGEEVSQELEISMGDAPRYDVTGGKVAIDSGSDASFQVPTGSRLYQVTINEKGNWDVTSAQLADAFEAGNVKMQYVGYVEVQAYGKNGEKTGTSWVKVDGNTSFQFALKDLGFHETTDRFELKYYAKAQNLSEVSDGLVTNNFRISGEVGIGKNVYKLNGLYVKVESKVSGGQSFEAGKDPWYYEYPKTQEGNWSKGALYWMIRIQGTELQKGISLKDRIVEKTGESYGTAFLHSDSLVGVYKGDLKDKHLKDFTDFEKENLDPIEENLYTIEYRNPVPESGDTFREFVLKTEETISLGEDSLYLVIKTEPAKLPEGNRDYKRFGNQLFTSDDGKSWMERESAYATITGGENILKELGRVISWDKEKKEKTIISEGKGGTIITDNLESGIYVSWAVKVNYAGKLAGTFQVLDELPAGMEVAYARLKWKGEKISKKDSIGMSQSSDLMGKGWEERSIEAETDNHETVTSYYYVKDDQVSWEITDLDAGNEVDQYAVDCQIVCRVTDQNVLLGGEKGTFTNQAKLLKNEELVDEPVSSTAEVEVTTLSKKGLDKGVKLEGSKYPFEIRVNELGQDLMKGSDTIVLVDKMSDTLKLDVTSIKVMTSGNHPEPVKFKAFFEDKLLKIVIPDHLPVTITYTADVQAAPGEHVAIDNVAYWEGYASTAKGKFSDEDYYYKVGAVVEVDITPQVLITKVNEKDLTEILPGAEFAMTQGTVNENKQFVEKPDRVWKGITDSKGVLRFGINNLANETRQDYLMEFGEVYKLVETKAPDGFLLNDTPHFFIVDKIKDGEEVDRTKYPNTADGYKIEVCYHHTHIYEIDIRNLPELIVTPSPSPEPTPTVSPSPSPEPTPTVTPSPSPEPTPTVTPSPSPEPTPTVTTVPPNVPDNPGTPGGGGKTPGGGTPDKEAVATGDETTALPYLLLLLGTSIVMLGVYKESARKK